MWLTWLLVLFLVTFIFFFFVGYRRKKPAVLDKETFLQTITFLYPELKKIKAESEEDRINLIIDYVNVKSRFFYVERKDDKFIIRPKL